MSSIDKKLQSVFEQALRSEVPGGNFSPSDVAAWDSLTHIKLIMELESHFGLSIGPDDIPLLYSDFDTVKSFVNDAATET